MMKKFILILIFVFCSLAAYSQSIAYAKEKHVGGKDYYYFYNSNAQVMKKVEVNNAKLVGYSAGLAVFEADRYYFIYSSTFTLLARLHKDDVGRIEHVFTDAMTGEDGFVAVRGNRAYIWDERGKNYKVIE